MSDKKCPRCGLWSTSSAINCDCGYLFEKTDLIDWSNSPDSSEENPQTRKILGIFMGIYIIAIFPICLLFPLTAGQCWQRCDPDIYYYAMIILFPFIVIGSVRRAWSLYKNGNFDAALIFGLFPLPWILVLLVKFFYYFSISNW